MIVEEFQNTVKQTLQRVKHASSDWNATLTVGSILENRKKPVAAQQLQLQQHISAAAAAAAAAAAVVVC